jgi:hypothetical protein
MPWTSSQLHNTFVLDLSSSFPVCQLSLAIHATMPIEPYLLYAVAIISLGTFQFGYNMVRIGPFV